MIKSPIKHFLFPRPVIFSQIITLAFLMNQIFSNRTAAQEVEFAPPVEDINSVKQFIHAAWPKTIHPADHGLPKPYTVPGVTGFNSFYYWDSYFTSIGLVLDGHAEMAQNNAEDMIALVEKMGYVPNGTREMNRSQPPVAGLQVKLCLPFVSDHAWRERAYSALEKEYGNWMATHAFPDGLNHYGSYSTPNELMSHLEEIRSRVGATTPDEPVAKQKFALHAMAVAESGWDYTPRWGDHCQDYASVDLNSLLYATEQVEADLAHELSNGRESLWRQRAAERLERMNRLMWDEERGLFVDYDESNRQRSSFISAASFFPLFCGITNQSQSDRSAQALAVLETPFGIDTCPPGEYLQSYQWASPNLWAPLQWAAVAGLWQNGHQPEAKRLAQKYIATVVRNFKITGELWEKYNAKTGGKDTANEYGNGPMIGWTAGVFLACCRIAGH
jgi:alpha,alpha-trehalase